MYYLAQSSSASNPEPVIRHSFTLPSFSTITTEVILKYENETHTNILFIFYLFRPLPQKHLVPVITLWSEQLIRKLLFCLVVWN